MSTFAGYEREGERKKKPRHTGISLLCDWTRDVSK